MKNLFSFIRSLFVQYSRDSFFLSFPQVISAVVSMAAFPLILSNLAMKDYGKVQFLLALQVWLVALTAPHITLGAKRGLSRGLDGTFLFAFLSRLKLIVPLGLLSFMGLVFISYFGLITQSFWLIFIVCAFIMVGYLPQVSYLEFFIAKKQFKDFAVWQIITVVAVPVASAVAAVATHDVVWFAMAQFGTMALMGWLATVHIVIKNRLVAAYRNGAIDRECFPYGVKLIPAGLILETANRITSFIIGPFFGFSDLATFSVANKLVDSARSLVSVPDNLLYSDFAQMAELTLAQKLRRRMRQGLAISFLLTLCCVSAGYAYIHFFLPASYQISKVYFLILSLRLPAIIFQLIMNTMLAVHFRYKELTALIVSQNVISILLIVVLGIFFKILGICWGVTLGAWIGAFLYYFVITARLSRVSS